MRTIAQEMQRSLHAPDMCFRLSGDEFVVLFHNTNRHAVDGLVAGVLERLKARRGNSRASLSSLEFSLAGFWRDASAG